VACKQVGQAFLPDPVGQECPTYPRFMSEQEQARFSRERRAPARHCPSGTGNKNSGEEQAKCRKRFSCFEITAWMYNLAHMSINKTRGFLYWLARLLGDVNAVKKGRVGRRVGRRMAGKVTGRGLGKLFK